MTAPVPRPAEEPDREALPPWREAASDESLVAVVVEALTDEVEAWRRPFVAKHVTAAIVRAQAALLPTPPAPDGGGTDLRGEVEWLLEGIASLCADWDANGNSRPLGDPTADTWHRASQQLNDLRTTYLRRAALAARDADQGALPAPLCGRCGHLFHHDDECEQVVGGGHGYHECGCPGDADQGAGDALAQVRARKAAYGREGMGDYRDGYTAALDDVLADLAALARATPEAGEGPS